MTISRRTFTTAVGLSALGGLVGLAPRAVRAAGEPIKIGWIAALTGPNSAAGLAFNTGVDYAVKTINEKGGVNGRPIDLITRDSQSDPTKAVNAAQEMINRENVNAIVGPANSGETLATTPIMARGGVPNLHCSIVDSLINVEKYPNAYRLSAANSVVDQHTRSYILNMRKAKKIAVIGDTTAFGVSAVKASVANFAKDGANVVYSAQIDPSQPDVSADIVRMKDAGTDLIVFWSDSPGLAARTLNARADWKVPVVGNFGLGARQVGALLDKPSNWEEVYISYYRYCCYDDAGKMTPRTTAFLDGAKAANYDLHGAQLTWVFMGFDAVSLVAAAIAATGSSDRQSIIGWLNTVKNYPGMFTDYSFSPTSHEGCPGSALVMAEANSGRSGAFRLAPGFSL
jgi:branched-chain amino acid transport system substrate-binding protein